MIARIARTEGAEAAVAALHTGMPGLACGPAGWTIAAERDLVAADAVLCGDRRYARSDGALDVRELVALRRFGLVAARFTPRDGVHAEHIAGAGATVAHRCGQLRLGLALALNDGALAHLRERVAGGVPVLQHQLVKGLVADAALELVHAREALSAPAPPIAVSRGAHARITRAGRMLLQLLGASGYLLTGAGATAHLSELIENVIAAEPREKEPRS